MLRYNAFVFLSFWAAAIPGTLHSEVPALFESLKGEWVGDGEIVDSSGETTLIHEEWTGAFLEDGTFEMKGTRQWGEDSQEFSWTFTRNDSLDLFECEYRQTGMEAPMRMEVSLSAERIELKAPFGDPGNELIITNTLTEAGIDGTVALMERGGQEALRGFVKHQRKAGAE